MATFRSRNRRTQRDSDKRRNRGPTAFWSDEIRIPKMSLKSDGVPILFLDAKYNNPKADGFLEDDYPAYIYLQGKVVVRDKAGKFKSMRSDCLPGWRRPCDDFPSDDPRVYDSRSDRPFTIWDHLKAQGDSRVGKSERYVLNCLDLRVHHLVERTDRDGKVIKYSKGDRSGQSVMERRPCEGKGCEHCEAETDQTMGRKGYMDLGSGHFGENGILGLEQTIEDNCRSCQEGELTRVALTCPECGEVCADSQVFSTEDMEGLFDEGMNCPECKAKGIFPMEELECSECKQPARAGLSDVVWFLRKTGEGKDSAVSAYRKKEQPWAWLKDFDMSGEDDYAVEDYDISENDEGKFVIKYEFHKDLKDMMKQYDFNNVKGIGIPKLSAAQVCDFLGISVPDGVDPGNEDAPAPTPSGGDSGGTRSSSRRRGGSRR